MRAIRALAAGPASAWSEAWRPASLASAAARALGSWAQGQGATATATPLVHQSQPPKGRSQVLECGVQEASRGAWVTPSLRAGASHTASLTAAGAGSAAGAGAGAGAAVLSSAVSSSALSLRSFASLGLLPPGPAPGAGAAMSWAGGAARAFPQGCTGSVPGATVGSAGDRAGGRVRALSGASGWAPLLAQAQGCTGGVPGATLPGAALGTAGARAGAAWGGGLFLSPLAQAQGCTRGVYVEVRGGNVDKAIRKYKAKLREDNLIRIARARSKHWKGAELRRLKGRESVIRRKTKDFKEKLAWIMAQKAKGL